MGLFDDFKAGIGEITSGRANERFKSGQGKIRKAVGAPDDPSTQPRVGASGILQAYKKKADTGGLGSISGGIPSGSSGGETPAGDLASQLGGLAEFYPDADFEAFERYNQQYEEVLKNNPTLAEMLPRKTIADFTKAEDEAASPLNLQSLLSDFIQPQLNRQSMQRQSIADQYQQAMGTIAQQFPMTGDYENFFARTVPQETMEMKKSAVQGEQIGGISALLKLMQAQAAQKAEQAYQRGLGTGASQAGSAAGGQLGF